MLLTKNTQTRVDTQMIGTKKNYFQIELKNRFAALELDDIDTLNMTMTEMISKTKCDEHSKTNHETEKA